MLNIHKLKKTNTYKKISFESGILIEDPKHYLSSSKEWYNSVYSFNKNNQKSLPSLNITVSNIIKWYFNMFSIKLENSILARRVAKWKRRLKLNRIFMGKPEFKHTNDKVIITLYVYNRELLLLNRKMKNLKRKIYVEYFKKLIFKNILLLTKINKIKNILKKIKTIKRKFYNASRNIFIRNKVKTFLRNKYLLKLKEVLNTFKSIKEKKNNKAIYIAKSLKYIESILDKNNRFRKKYGKLSKNNILMKLSYMMTNNDTYRYINSDNIDNIAKNSKFQTSRLIYINIIKKILVTIRLYLRYNRAIFYNKSKFNLHLISLKRLLEKIYKKEVEFNIVNLKSYNLDSNILTQIMAIKLRNRKNRLARVMDRVLDKIRLPLTRRLDYYKIIPKDKLIQNFLIRKLTRNNTYNAIPGIVPKSLYKKSGIELKELSLIESNNDKLDSILKVIYPIEYTMNNNLNETVRYVYKRNVKNTTLDSIKNKLINGIRIEASGRLSKRIIASKAIFKMKQKGTIRNIDSSYKKLSTTLLRGNFKSSLQFSNTSNKTRIGAFGIKGWISSI